MDGPHTQAFWDARFEGEAYRFGEAPNAFLARQAGRLSPGMSVLAVGDGEGRNGVWLAEQGLDVHSLDISPRAVDKARRLAARRGLSIRAEVTDLLHWQWPPAVYDAVVAVFVQFAGPAWQDRLFAGMKSTVRPGGLIILEGYRPEQIAFGTGGPPDPTYMYTHDLLQAAFADFEMLELAAYDAELSEGDAHAGLSAVIDLVARRPN
jgi:SAM-dependent methyltransferase